MTYVAILEIEIAHWRAEHETRRTLRAIELGYAPVVINVMGAEAARCWAAWFEARESYERSFEKLYGSDLERDVASDAA